jgi:hypothetical protein
MASECPQMTQCLYLVSYTSLKLKKTGMGTKTYVGSRSVIISTIYLFPLFFKGKWLKPEHLLFLCGRWVDIHTRNSGWTYVLALILRNNFLGRNNAVPCFPLSVCCYGPHTRSNKFAQKRVAQQQTLSVHETIRSANLSLFANVIKKTCPKLPVWQLFLLVSRKNRPDIERGKSVFG